MATAAEPLVIKPSDPADTTEEAVLALLKALHDGAANDLETAPEAQQTFIRGRIDSLRTAARLICDGEHWNVPGVSI